jgi:hypothetical protein
MRFIVATVAVLAILTFTDSAASAQEYRAGPRVRVLSGGVDYGDQRIQGQSLIFQGESLVLEVGVANQYEGPPAAAELDWEWRLMVSIIPGGRFDFDRRNGRIVRCGFPSRTRSQYARTESDRVVLLPTGFIYAQCAVDLSAYAARPGRYTVISEWLRSGDMLPFREQAGLAGQSIGMTDLLELEVREVKTSNDQADLLNHLARHALRQGQPNSALQFLQQLFQLHPSSLTGLAISAQAHVALGECGQAVTDLKREAAIIEEGLDSGNAGLQSLGAEHRRAGAQSLRDQADHLTCSGR